MSDHSITSLIEKLEGGPVYLTHKEAYDLAVALGSDVALSLANTISKAFAGKSLDGALALAERIMGGKEALLLLTDLLTREADASDFDSITVSDLPPLLCAAILRAQSEVR